MVESALWHRLGQRTVSLLKRRVANPLATDKGDVNRGAKHAYYYFPMNLPEYGMVVTPGIILIENVYIPCTYISTLP